MLEHQRPALEKRRNMFRRIALQLAYLLTTLLLLFGSSTAAAQELPPDKIPPGGDFAPTTNGRVTADVIIVKGAEPSASDHATSLPEEGAVTINVYRNRYFGLTYPIPPDWAESFKGPPPSDTGTYVLANLLPAASFKRAVKGTIMFSAQDIFFSL